MYYVEDSLVFDKAYIFSKKCLDIKFMLLSNKQMHIKKLEWNTSNRM